VPSKRQPSKQRRAAQNRAQREALAARREHASQAATTAASTGSSGSSGGSGSSGAAGRGRSSLLSGLTGTGGAKNQARPVRPLGGFGGRIMGGTAGEPGARGVLLSVPLAIAAAIYMLGFFTLAVDDRGNQLPRAAGSFRGLYLATREALTGQEVVARQELAVSAIGSVWVALTMIPLLVVFGVFYVFRYRHAQSTYWTVTIGMLVVAASILLAGQTPYIGAMAALTWASFQIRRSELPVKMAEREAARAARAEAAAAKAAEDDDEAYDEEAYDEEAYEDDDAEDDDAEDDTEYDTEYDEDAYEEEAYDDGEPQDGGSAEDESGGADDDVLKELEAEMDEDEGRSGGTAPGPR
jgi:hypothetical protein